MSGRAFQQQPLLLEKLGQKSQQKIEFGFIENLNRFTYGSNQAVANKIGTVREPLQISELNDIKPRSINQNAVLSAADLKKNSQSSVFSYFQNLDVQDETFLNQTVTSTLSDIQKMPAQQRAKFVKTILEAIGNETLQTEANNATYTIDLQVATVTRDEDIYNERNKRIAGSSDLVEQAEAQRNFKMLNFLNYKRDELDRIKIELNSDDPNVQLAAQKAMSDFIRTYEKNKRDTFDLANDILLNSLKGKIAPELLSHLKNNIGIDLSVAKQNYDLLVSVDAQKAQLQNIEKLVSGVTTGGSLFDKLKSLIDAQQQKINEVQSKGDAALLIAADLNILQQINGLNEKQILDFDLNTVQNLAIKNAIAQRQNQIKSQLQTQTKIDTLNDQIKTLSDEKTKLQNSLTTSQTQNAAYKKQLDAKTEEIKKLTTETTNLQTQIDNLKKVVNKSPEVNTAIKALNDQITTLNNEKTKLQTDLDEFKKQSALKQKQELDAKDATIKKLTEERDKLKTSGASLTTKDEEIAKLKSSLTTQQNEADAAIKKLNSEISELNKKITTAPVAKVEEEISIQKILQKLNGTNITLSEKENKVYSGLQTTWQDNATKVQTAETNLKNNTTELKKAQDLTNQLLSSLNIKVDLAKPTQAVLDFQTALKEKQALISDLETKVKDLKNSTAEASLKTTIQAKDEEIKKLKEANEVKSNTIYREVENAAQKLLQETNGDSFKKLQYNGELKEFTVQTKVKTSVFVSGKNEKLFIRKNALDLELKVSSSSAKQDVNASFLTNVDNVFQTAWEGNEFYSYASTFAENIVGILFTKEIEVKAKSTDTPKKFSLEVKKYFAKYFGYDIVYQTFMGIKIQPIINHLLTSSSAKDSNKSWADPPPSQEWLMKSIQKSIGTTMFNKLNSFASLIDLDNRKFPN